MCLPFIFLTNVNMYKAKTISKKDLVELYGGVSRIYGFERGNPEYFEQLTLPPSETLEVEMLTVSGANSPFTIVRLLDIPRAANHMIIPGSMVRVIELPSATEKFKEVLDRLIGVGNWSYLEGEQRLILFYPKIEITNTLNAKHTIQDLIVAVPMTVKGAIHRIELFGVRTAMTDQERSTNYSHSHLSSSTGRAQPFCLGGGAFPLYMGKLNRVLAPEELELFLENLKAYLSWESIEGKPYQLFSNIGRITQRVPEYTGNYPSFTGHNLVDERQIDELARYVVKQLPQYPELVTYQSTGWSLNPAMDANKYLDIEASIYDNINSGAIKQKFFADYDRNTFTYVGSLSRSRSANRIELDGVAYTWAANLGKTQTRIIETQDTPISTTTIKMPFIRIRTEIIRRVNFYLARARQQLNTNGERSNINNKAEGTVVADPNQSDRVHAQPVS